MEESHKLDDLGKTDIFIGQWIDDFRNQAWCSVEAETLTDKQVLRLFQTLVAKALEALLGNKNPYSCNPHFLTKIIGRPVPQLVHRIFDKRKTEEALTDAVPQSPSLDDCEDPLGAFRGSVADETMADAVTDAVPQAEAESSEKHPGEAPLLPRGSVADETMADAVTDAYPLVCGIQQAVVVSTGSKRKKPSGAFRRQKRKLAAMQLQLQQKQPT